MARQSTRKKAADKFPLTFQRAGRKTLRTHGHATPKSIWYDPDRSEFVMRAQGAARLRFEDGWIEMNLGSFIDIAADCRHHVEWADPKQR